MEGVGPADVRGREPELQLLAALAGDLRSRTLVDVGAERGALSAQLADAGYTPITLLEPNPDSAAELRRRFASRSDATVVELAAGADDNRTTLHRAHDAAGRPLPQFATTLPRPPTAAVRWDGSVTVEQRTLASLVHDGTLPAKVGLLKVDAEGAERDILAGAAGLRGEIVMVEFWADLPDTLGRCPWSLDEVVELARGLGAERFVWFRHRQLHTSIEWDAAHPESGEWGNLVFLADHLVEPAQRAVVAVRGAFEERLEARAEALQRAADERIVKIEAIETELLAQQAELSNRQDAMIARLEDIAARLSRRGPGWWIAHANHRWHQLKAPRLGTFWQTAPQPLGVPAAYLEDRPPSPPPSISIVTPSLRHGQFLERALSSVLDQGYPALEYVVQDGGSDDGSVEVLERHADRLAAWASAPDAGQAHALNLGFAQTTGEIMAYLNADDMLLPGALAHVAGHFAAHPEVDVVYGQRVIIDEDGRRIGLWILPPHDNRAITYVDYVPQETMFWRRRTWEEAGGRIDEDFHYALDWDLLLRFQAAGARVERLPRLLAAFRVHSDQKTSALSELGEAECRRLRKRHAGAALSHAEAAQRIRGYMRRHVLHHTAYRWRERREDDWVAVPADPVDDQRNPGATQ